MSCKINNVHSFLMKSVIHCGKVSNDERVYSKYVEFFGRNVEVFTASSDYKRRDLFRTSALAMKFGYPTNKIGMFVARIKTDTDDVYQASKFRFKRPKSKGLKVGGYFLSLSMCMLYERICRPEKTLRIVMSENGNNSNSSTLYHNKSHLSHFNFNYPNKQKVLESKSSKNGKYYGTQLNNGGCIANSLITPCSMYTFPAVVQASTTDPNIVYATNSQNISTHKISIRDSTLQSSTGVLPFSDIKLLAAVCERVYTDSYHPDSSNKIPKMKISNLSQPMKPALCNA